MPRLRTIDDLVESCQQQVDLENHGVITRPEWQRYLSRAYGTEIWTTVRKAASRYFETYEEYTTDGTAYLEEPANFLSFTSLSYVDGTASYDLQPLQPQERAQATRLAVGERARFYERVDDRIYLYPTPPSGQTYMLRYSPQSPDLTTYDSDDCVDVVSPAGEDLLIWSVSVRACAKTEADPGLAIREREECRRAFAEEAGELDQFAPQRRIVDSDLDDEDRPW